MCTKEKKEKASLKETEAEIRRVWFATDGGRSVGEREQRKASAIVGMLKFFSLYDAVEGTGHTAVIMRLYLKRDRHGAVADSLACGCSPATLYRYRLKYVAVYNLLL